MNDKVRRLLDIFEMVESWTHDTLEAQAVLEEHDGEHDVEDRIAMLEWSIRMAVKRGASGRPPIRRGKGGDWKGAEAALEGLVAS